MLLSTILLGTNGSNQGYSKDMRQPQTIPCPALLPIVGVEAVFLRGGTGFLDSGEREGYAEWEGRILLVIST
jgi:hypothetical protein